MGYFVGPRYHNRVGMLKVVLEKDELIERLVFERGGLVGKD